MKTDGDLLHSYTETKSEHAFAELVERHLNLVYSAALRQVNGDAHLAQDVAQTVFADLARKAASLAHRPVLTGWLYTSAHFAAAKAVRTEQRRHTHEAEAQAMNQLLSDPAPDLDWERLRPVLDAAMLELHEPDREAVLLRYFDNRAHAEIAERLGLSENAARMRVERALDKLREHLSRRGIRTTASALSVAIAANAVQAAPAGLAATLSTAALAGTTLAATATKAIAMTTLQKTLIAATLTAAVCTGIYEAQQAFQLREQNQTLRQQQAPLLGQIEQLTSERDGTARQLVALREDNARLKSNTAELHRLRGEVALFRQNPTRAGSGEEEMAQLRHALAEAQSKVERFEFEKVDQSILDDMKQLVLGMRARPRDSNGFMATNFGQIISELSVKTNANGSVLFSQSGNELTIFEFMHAGQVNDTMLQRLIFREKIPRKTPDGNWTRIYGRADGSVQKRESPTGNFELWESVSDLIEPPGEP